MVVMGRDRSRWRKSSKQEMPSRFLTYDDQSKARIKPKVFCERCEIDHFTRNFFNVEGKVIFEDDISDSESTQKRIENGATSPF